MQKILSGKRPIVFAAFIVAVIILLILANILPLASRESSAAASFQSNYNSGGYDASFSLGSATASTDTALPSLATGYNSTNSLSYSYDGTSTLKYTTASNLPTDKGSIEMKFQKSAYGSNVNQDVGSMNRPSGIAYDSTTQYIYTADRQNHRIIKTKIDGTGWVTFGHYGTGAGEFAYPSDVAFDSSTGFLYVKDSCNGRIVKTKFDGTGWETLTGLGTDSCNTGNIGWYHENTHRLFFDSVSGYLYITQGNESSTIVKSQIDGTGRTNLTSFGGHTIPNAMTGLWYDSASGYIFVTTTAGHLIRTKEDGTGWSDISGFSTAGVGSLYYDPVSTYLYVANSYSGQIVKCYYDGSSWQTLGGFSFPTDVFVDTSSGMMYVSNTSGHNIIKTADFSTTGWTAYGSYYNNPLKFGGGAGSSYFDNQGVSYDSSSGYLYIADNPRCRIIKTKLDGTGWESYGTCGSGVGQFKYPSGVFYDSNSGYIYVGDRGNSRLVKTKIDGTGWTTLNANEGPMGIFYDSNTDYVYYTEYNYLKKTKMDGTGTGSLAGFNLPSNIYYDTASDPSHDGSGYLYITNRNANNIIKTKFDGTGWMAYGTSGSGTGQFSYPIGVSYDSATGYLYVGDTGNSRVVKTKLDGSWTGWTAYGASGAGTGQFNSNKSMSYDSSSGNLYIYDANNYRIVKISDVLDGTGWQTTSNFTGKEKILFSAQATDDSRLVYDVLSRRLRFYLAYSNKAQFVETPTLDLTDGQWYTVKASFNKAAHTLALDLDGTNQATATYDSDWGSLSFGTNFYIGALNASTTDRWDGMIDDINIDIEAVDTTDPTNPTAANTHFYADSGKSLEFVSGDWGNSASPYITWSGASDADSGLNGYYLYFGTDAAAEPNSSSGLLTPNSGARLLQTHSGADGAEQNVTVPAASLTSGVTYYFIVRTQDHDLNTAAKITLFTYKYDGDAPSAPEYVNASPAGCSTSAKFTFTWDAINDPLSGIAGYDYKNGSTGVITDAGNTGTLEKAAYQEGDNIIYIRAKDNAGNVSGWQTAVYCSTGIARLIDGPAVSAGPSSIVVDWVSSKTTTSYVQVYEGNTYISEQGHTSYDISHSVKVVGLEPQKTYKYKLVWTDSSGNIDESDWYETTTSPEPTISNVKTEIVSPTQAIVSWESSEESKGELQYGVGSLVSSIPIANFSKSFTVSLNNLSGGSIYSLKVKSQTLDGYSFYSDSYNFQTPPVPIISDLRFEDIPGLPSPAVKVTWNTNVAATSSIFYGTHNSSKKETGSSDKVTSHEVSITGLDDNTTYEIYALSTDQYGNTAKSDNHNFTTGFDTRPPEISDVVIETSNVGLDRQDKAQVVVSWKTDEPSTSQVEFGEGISSTDYSNKTQEDKAYTTNHMVIVSDLTPSKPYHLRVLSVDKGSNLSTSDDHTIISGDVPKSALQTILDTFQKIFGWLGLK